MNDLIPKTISVRGKISGFYETAGMITIFRKQKGIPKAILKQFFGRNPSGNVHFLKEALGTAQQTVKLRNIVTCELEIFHEAKGYKAVSVKKLKRPTPQKSNTLKPPALDLAA